MNFFSNALIAIFIKIPPKIWISGSHVTSLICEMFERIAMEQEMYYHRPWKYQVEPIITKINCVTLANANLVWFSKTVSENSEKVQYWKG